MEAWRQVNRQTLVAINAQILVMSVLRENVQYTYSPALLDDAYLVCRLGGIIKIVQVNTEPEKPDDLYIVIKDGGIRLRDDDEISDTIKTLNKNRVLRINNKASKEFEGNTYVSVYYDDSKIGWVAEKFISKVDSDTEKYTVLYTDLTDDEVHVVGTLIGETLTLSDRESKACAHTVINRTKYPQWSAQSLYDICNVREYNGAGNEVYEDFKKYYDEGRNMAYEGKMGEAWKYEQKINAILPVIRGQEADFTDNAVYFSTRPMSYHGKQVLIGENFTHMFYQYK